MGGGYEKINKSKSRNEVGPSAEETIGLESTYLSSVI